jgi:hypothetical protein
MNADYYSEKFKNINKRIHKEEYYFFNKVLEKFKIEYINKNLIENTSLLFDYNFELKILKINSFSINYKDKDFLFKTVFFIDKNKNNNIKFNIKYNIKNINFDKLKCKQHCKDTKNIIKNKKIIFNIINDFKIYIEKYKKLSEKLIKYNQIFFIKKEENLYLNFNKIFKKEKNIDIYEYLNKYYKNELVSEKNIKYKIINCINETYKEKFLFFHMETIKIFNYRKNNEFFVLNKKIISKKQFIKILSNSLIYKSLALKEYNQIPFKNSNLHYHNHNQYEYTVISEFINKSLMKLNIHNF